MLVVFVVDWEREVGVRWVWVSGWEMEGRRLLLWGWGVEGRGVMLVCEAEGRSESVHLLCWCVRGRCWVDVDVDVDLGDGGPGERRKKIRLWVLGRWESEEASRVCWVQES